MKKQKQFQQLKDGSWEKMNLGILDAALKLTFKEYELLKISLKCRYLPQQKEIIA